MAQLLDETFELPADDSSAWPVAEDIEFTSPRFAHSPAQPRPIETFAEPALPVKLRADKKPLTLRQVRYGEH